MRRKFLLFLLLFLLPRLPQMKRMMNPQMDGRLTHQVLLRQSRL
jgi:hypothetical protein